MLPLAAARRERSALAVCARGSRTRVWSTVNNTAVSRTRLRTAVVHRHSLTVRTGRSSRSASTGPLAPRYQRDQRDQHDPRHSHSGPPIFEKLWRARSPPYRSRFLRPRSHFSAFFEIYKIYLPSHRSKLKILQEVRMKICN